jgi:hypothetical protein
LKLRPKIGGKADLWRGALQSVWNYAIFMEMANIKKKEKKPTMMKIKNPRRRADGGFFVL